ncbi:SRPBCC family protein [Arthrobacter zhaoxinii]|uniref:SRPBCC family protein n=1 Tax=Arthrobacter zhaoxinii TaxID=2964616 RepID=UPI002107F0BC|nr:SRPBCC domain-containing protein [Arthrobacter zhaoxinii]MCQ2001576.1 SRPBCC domain-containing protein [Arthrobacter zhaoxinii]
MRDQFPDGVLPDEDFLHMVRDLPSGPTAIYEAWMDLARITSWWGAAGFIVPPDRISAHQHVGGDYQACMVNTATGDELWWGGEYLVLDPPHRLEVTQQWQQSDGAPAGPKRVIRIELHPMDAGEGAPVTRMTFREGPFAAADGEIEGYESGWNESFNRLAGYLARQRGPE